MYTLLIGTCHPLQYDNPPAVCPTNQYGEAQKLLHQLWLQKLIKEFNPAIVFDESYSALTTFGLVHAENDFYRHTAYVPFEFPWVHMDVPMNFRHVEKLRGISNAADESYRKFLREDYWLQTIFWVANAVGAQRIAVVCGYEHVQEKRLEARLRAAGQVETHDVHDQRWYNLEWTRRRHDQLTVDGWAEEHVKKRLRLGDDVGDDRSVASLQRTGPHNCESLETLPLSCCRIQHGKFHSPSVTSNLAPNFKTLHHCPSTGSRASPHNADTSEKKSGHNSFVSRILTPKFFDMRILRGNSLLTR
jgi:hypothetical protein